VKVSHHSKRSKNPLWGGLPSLKRVGGNGTSCRRGAERKIKMADVLRREKKEKGEKKAVPARGGSTRSLPKEPQERSLGRTNLKGRDKEGTFLPRNGTTNGEKRKRLRYVQKHRPQAGKIARGGGDRILANLVPHLQGLTKERNPILPSRREGVCKTKERGENIPFIR